MCRRKVQGADKESYLKSNCRRKSWNELLCPGNVTMLEVGTINYNFPYGYNFPHDLCSMQIYHTTSLVWCGGIIDQSDPYQIIPGSQLWLILVDLTVSGPMLIWVFVSNDWHLLIKTLRKSLHSITLESDADLGGVTVIWECDNDFESMTHAVRLCGQSTVTITQPHQTARMDSQSVIMIRSDSIPTV